MVMVFAMISSLAQLTAPNELRGRVMSIYMVAFRGGMPLGSLVAGYMATVTSPPAVLTVNGVLLGSVAAWFLIGGGAWTFRPRAHAKACALQARIRSSLGAVRARTRSPWVEMSRWPPSLTRSP